MVLGSEIEDEVKPLQSLVVLELSSFSASSFVASAVVLSHLDELRAALLYGIFPYCFEVRDLVVGLLELIELDFHDRVDVHHLLHLVVEVSADSLNQLHGTLNSVGLHRVTLELLNLFEYRLYRFSNQLDGVSLKELAHARLQVFQGVLELFGKPEGGLNQVLVDIGEAQDLTILLGLLEHSEGDLNLFRLDLLSDVTEDLVKLSPVVDFSHGVLGGDDVLVGVDLLDLLHPDLELVEQAVNEHSVIEVEVSHLDGSSFLFTFSELG